ncbi:MAG TPA: hypothetical protein [Caudoviricetes sp.]|jgi:hypothetical protein|nr:MAG TPA: hypothetical protein [Caudoviricetes sp.]
MVPFVLVSLLRRIATFKEEGRYDVSPFSPTQLTLATTGILSLLKRRGA